MELTIDLLNAENMMAMSAPRANVSDVIHLICCFPSGRNTRRYGSSSTDPSNNTQVAHLSRLICNTPKCSRRRRSRASLQRQLDGYFSIGLITIFAHGKPFQRIRRPEVRTTHFLKYSCNHTRHFQEAS